MHQKSLDINLKAFGPDHPSVAHAHCNMQCVYMEMGDYEKALEYCNKILLAYAPGHEATLYAHYNIACIHSLAGATEQALTSLEEAVRAGY